MDLLEKVKEYLTKESGYDFASEFWTDENMCIVIDAVNAAEEVLKNVQKPTSVSAKEFVKKWMDGHEPDTFVKNEHGNVIYSAKHSSINVTCFFEDLLVDFIEENGQ